MSYTIVNDNTLTAIADAIRIKGGTTSMYKPGEMANAINSLPFMTAEEQRDALVQRTLIGLFSNNELTSIGEYAFSGCTRLVGVDVPNVITIGSMAFEKCTSLKSVNIPNVETIGSLAFNKCTALKSIDLPKVKEICQFGGCSSLTTADLGAATSIPQYGFYNTQLTTLILRASSVVKLNNYAFTNTPLSNGSGYIYVPSHLVASYKSNTTGWQSYT